MVAKQIKTVANASDLGYEILRTVVLSTLSATSIAWWIWIVQSMLEQLRSNHISFVVLVFECFRGLVTILVFLTIMVFL